MGAWPHLILDDPALSTEQQLMVVVIDETEYPMSDHHLGHADTRTVTAIETELASALDQIRRVLTCSIVSYTHPSRGGITHLFLLYKTKLNVLMHTCSQ